MRRIDERFLMAATLMTIVAVVVYIALGWQAERITANMIGTMGGVEQAPLIVIATIRSYWWFIYGAAMLGLILKWVIKRLMN